MRSSISSRPSSRQVGPGQGLRQRHRQPAGTVDGPELPRAVVATVALPDWSCVELKHLDSDEFAHWSHTDFDASVRTKRKRREWEVFNALARGGEPPAGVVAVEAPDGGHVIDHVRSVWLRGTPLPRTA